jgi:hypothetical protein
MQLAWHKVDGSLDVLRSPAPIDAHTRQFEVYVHNFALYDVRFRYRVPFSSGFIKWCDYPHGSIPAQLYHDIQEAIGRFYDQQRTLAMA